MKDRYLRQFNFLRDRIEVIYNGFDQKGSDPLRLHCFLNSLFFTLGISMPNRRHEIRVSFSLPSELVAEEKIPNDRLRVLFVGERYNEVERMIADKVSQATWCLQADFPIMLPWTI